MDEMNEMNEIIESENETPLTKQKILQEIIPQEKKKGNLHQNHNHKNK